MKRILWGLIVAVLLIIAIVGDINRFQSSEASQASSKEAVAVEASQVNAPDAFAVETADVWTPTFQLCWNEFIKLVDRNNTIEYVEGNPKLANELNKQKYTKSDLNPDSYYIKVGKMTQKLKKTIEKDIKAKFNETSDILDKFVFEKLKDEETNKYFIYSMLIKNFPFQYAFEPIANNYFADDKVQRYKYFGFSEDRETREKQALNIEDVFYVDDEDFALKFYNKDKTEEMYLYLTSSNASFEEVYKEMIEKSKNKEEYYEKRVEKLAAKFPNRQILKGNDYLKVPYLSINEEFKYNKELARKEIKGKTYEQNGLYWEILDTIQTIKFNLDNEGAKLKSEAAIVAHYMTASAHTPRYLHNYYYFDRPFVLFLKEKDKDKPYFAVRVKDEKYLVKAK